MAEIKVSLEILKNDDGRYYANCHFGDKVLSGENKTFASREECGDFFDELLPKMLSEIGITDIKKTHDYGKPIQ